MRLLADVAWPSGTFATIDFDDYGGPPSFATVADGVYTLTKPGSYLVHCQMMHDSEALVSLNLYYKPNGGAEELICTLREVSGSTDSGLFGIGIIKGAVGDEIDVRAYFNDPGYHVKRKSAGSPAYTAVTVTRLGN